jgi:hypothetical protein
MRNNVREKNKIKTNHVCAESLMDRVMDKNTPL